MAQLKEKEAIKMEIIKQVNKNSIHTIKVLGETVYIMENQTILRIGHTTKTIEGNRMFSLLDKKIQEFMVHLVLCLLKSKSKNNNRYFKTDKIALDFIMKKYPKKPKEFWYSAFIIILQSSSSESNGHLNLLRAQKFYKHINKNK
jgi:hypothetical protein